MGNKSKKVSKNRSRGKHVPSSNKHVAHKQTHQGNNKQQICGKQVNNYKQPTKKDYEKVKETLSNKRTTIKRRDVVEILYQLGFQKACDKGRGKRIGTKNGVGNGTGKGSHELWRHPQNGKTFLITSKENQDPAMGRTLRQYLSSLNI